MRYKLLLLSLMVVIPLGCASLKDSLGIDAKKDRQTKIAEVPAGDFVNYLNTRAGQLQSINYERVDLRATEGRMPLPSLEGSLAAAQPRSFRMKVSKLSADVDMGSNPDQFWAYIKAPGNDAQYLYASHQDFDTGKAQLPRNLPFEPDWVMQALGMITFSAKNQYTVAINERERTYTLSWSTTTPSGIAIRKEVVFDADNATGTKPQVKKHVIKDDKNKVLAYAEIRSVQTAQTVMERDSGRPVTIQYPTHVILKWEEQKFEMDLKLTKAVVNQQLNGEQAHRLFSRPNVPGVNAIDLAEYKFK